MPHITSVRLPLRRRAARGPGPPQRPVRRRSSTAPAGVGLHSPFCSLDEPTKLAVDVGVDSGGKDEPEAVRYAPRKARFAVDACPTEAHPATLQGVVDSLQGVNKCLTGIHTTTRDLLGARVSL